MALSTWCREADEALQSCSWEEGEITGKVTEVLMCSPPMRRGTV